MVVRVGLVEPLHQFGAGRLLELLDDVGGHVGRHAGQQDGRGLPRQRLDDLGAEIQFRLVENLDRNIDRQKHQHRRRVLRFELVENFDVIGDMAVTQARGQRVHIKVAVRCGGVGIRHSSPSWSAGNGRPGELIKLSDRRRCRRGMWRGTLQGTRTVAWHLYGVPVMGVRPRAQASRLADMILQPDGVKKKARSLRFGKLM